MSFEYHEPETLEEALRLLADHGSDGRPLAGGTAFALMYRLGLMRAPHVIGLSGIAELGGIEARDDGLWIGALATHRQVERSADARRHDSMLPDAFGRIASIRIRSQATVGGNLCHADPAQDPPPVLIALGATAHIARAGGGGRTIPVEEFFTGYYTADLGEDELLLGVLLPTAPKRAKSIYLKYLPRTTDDYATVSVAASVAMNEAGVVQHARIALGGVGPTPLRARVVEEALIGQRLTEETVDEVSHLVEGEIMPIDDVRGSARYKRAMAPVWVRRALAGTSAGTVET